MGLFGLYGTSFGYLATSISVVLGGIALYALGASPLLVLAVGLVFVVTAWSYAEGSAAMPDASGVASFARRAFDPMTGFIAAWAVLLDSLILVALACTFIPYYLGAVWPPLQEQPYATVVGIAVVALLVALNVLGLQESVRLSSLTAALGLGTLAVLIVAGFATVVSAGDLLRQVDLGVAPTWRHLLFAVPLAAAAFTGLDAVSSRAESALRPGKDVPRALNVVLPLIVVLAVCLSAVALSALPVGSNTVPVDTATGLTRAVPVQPAAGGDGLVLAADPTTEVVVPVEQTDAGLVIPAQAPTGEVIELGGEAATRLYGTPLGSAYLEDPLIGLVDGLPASLGWLTTPLRPWVALLTALALLLAANALMGGSARIVYSLARHGQVPALLGRVSASRLTPYVGIVLFGVTAAALIVPTHPRLLLELFGFGAMVAFTLAHLSVIALRYRESGLARPYVVPFSVRFRGAALPVPAVIGAFATAAIWALMVATHPTGRIVGLAWMAGGIGMYVLHRRRSGQPLRRQPETSALPSSAVTDIDYEHILVPVVGTRLTDEMVVLGCQLAAEKGATIDIVYVIEVPMSMPLTATLPAERRRGRAVLDAAMAVARDFGIEAWPHLVTARQAGRAIIDTAVEWNADVIVIGVVKRRAVGDRLFGNTVSHVLRHAPREVVVNMVPADYPMLGSAAEFDAAEAARTAATGGEAGRQAAAAGASSSASAAGSGGGE